MCLRKSMKSQKKIYKCLRKSMIKYANLQIYSFNFFMYTLTTALPRFLVTLSDTNNLSLYIRHMLHTSLMHLICMLSIDSLTQRDTALYCTKTLCKSIKWNLLVTLIVTVVNTAFSEAQCRTLYKWKAPIYGIYLEYYESLPGKGS